MTKRILTVIAFVALLAGTGVLVKVLGRFSYETEKFEKSGAAYVIKAQYPKITNRRLSPEARQKVNVEIDRFTRSLFEGDLKKFIVAGAKWTPEELKKIAGRDTVDIRFEIVYMDKRRINIRFEKFSSWIGAAHGVTEVIGFNYDLRAMKVLELTKKVSKAGS